MTTSNVTRWTSADARILVNKLQLLINRVEVEKQINHRNTMQLAKTTVINRDRKLRAKITSAKVLLFDLDPKLFEHEQTPSIRKTGSA